MKFRQRETVLVQNYADYRYFKRFFSQSVQWMPGSGGVYRKCELESCFVVTRDEKFGIVEKSIKDFMRVNKVTNVKVIGLKSKKVAEKAYTSIGYVSQNEICLWF